MLTQKRQSTSPNYIRRLEAWDIGSLRIFCTVVETGSFSAAARLLNLAASTISKHISGLEHALERPNLGPSKVVQADTVTHRERFSIC